MSSAETQGIPEGGVLWIATLAWGLLVAAVLSFLALRALGVVGSSSGDRALLPGDRALRIVDQRIRAQDGGSLYIAVVENRGRRAAVNVVPDGEFKSGSGQSLGKPHAPSDVYQSATIPAGGRGVVIDWFDGEPGVGRSTRRYAIRMHADGGFATAGPAPARIGHVRLDHRRCIAWATVVGRRRLRQVDLELVLRDRRGRILDYWVGVAGPVPRGSSRQAVTRIPPEECGTRARVTAYPLWSLDELRRSHGRPA